jgi:hypothetical protein
MKTAGNENPNSHIRLCTEPSPWDGRSKPSSLIHTGWKARKYPAMGEVFFLTFPFIELIRRWLIFSASLYDLNHEVPSLKTSPNLRRRVLFERGVWGH